MFKEHFEQSKTSSEVYTNIDEVFAEEALDVARELITEMTVFERDGILMTPELMSRINETLDNVRDAQKGKTEHAQQLMGAIAQITTLRDALEKLSVQ